MGRQVPTGWKLNETRVARGWWELLAGASQEVKASSFVLRIVLLWFYDYTLFVAPTFDHLARFEFFLRWFLKLRCNGNFRLLWKSRTTFIIDQSFSRILRDFCLIPPVIRRCRVYQNISVCSFILRWFYMCDTSVPTSFFLHRTLLPSMGRILVSYDIWFHFSFISLDYLS